MKTLKITLLLLLPSYVFGQNVGIGILNPTEKLEVKNPLRSTLKISSAGYSDTTQLLFSNVDGTGAGTYYSVKATREEGLFFSTSSDLPGNNSDNSLVITPNGFIGVGVLPTAKFHVNGLVKIQGLNLMEFGAEIPGKEASAGMIGYNAFGTNALTFVGAGTTVSNRAVYFFAEGGTTFGGPTTVNGNSYIIGNTGMGIPIPTQKLDIAGSVKLTGEINRPATTTSDLIPIAWGNVSPTGFVQLNSSTGNFTVERSTTGIYLITITGEEYQFQNYSALATPVSSSPFIATTGSGADQLQVYIYNTTGARADCHFNFVVYKK
jgi:hypothetical protein